MEPASAPPPSGADPPIPTPSSTSATDEQRRPKRKIRNYLLDTGMQLKLASYLLGFAVALSVGLGWHLWTAYRETSEVVALAAPEVAAALATEDRWRIVQVSVILVARPLVPARRVGGDHAPDRRPRLRHPADLRPGLRGEPRPGRGRCGATTCSSISPTPSPRWWTRCATGRRWTAR